MPIKDADIRRSLLKTIEKANEGSTYRVLPELAVCDGDARVDIAVANGKLCGYEIKSDADTLERLEVQKQCYNRTFDKVYIVIGKKFENEIRERVPEWWGIYVATIEGRQRVVNIRKERQAAPNPKVDAKALLELLWAEELRSLLKKYEIKGTSGKNRRILRSIAFDKIPYEDIRHYARETLKSRSIWRPDQVLITPRPKVR